MSTMTREAPCLQARGMPRRSFTTGHEQLRPPGQHQAWHRPPPGLPPANRRPGEPLTRSAVPARAPTQAKPAARYFTGIPCKDVDPELFFAESPAGVDAAKALCLSCPLRSSCLTEAIARREPCGVWGGELFDGGAIVPRKRPRGRPRKSDAERDAAWFETHAQLSGTAPRRTEAVA